MHVSTTEISVPEAMEDCYCADPRNVVVSTLSILRRFPFLSQPPQSTLGVLKFWLDPVALAHSGVLNRSELRRVERIVKENWTSFPGRWNARFNN